MKVTHSEYLSFKENAVQGRYVVNEQILRYLKKTSSKVLVQFIGTSVQDRPIHSMKLGEGQKKVLMWSQMHGNESTTTKAVLDLINCLSRENEFAQKIRKNCTILIIPMLNPDGAQAYIRLNANEIDLNRDAQKRSEPESVILRDTFDRFQPDYCFNLHDQRTIFNVGDTPKPATVSFLAPAHDEERSVSATRGLSMQLIAAMNSQLQKMIPGQVGRYDDAFNHNCVGDTFQMLETPTLLFEAGHFTNDYQRESTREYIFHALTKALDTIAENKINEHSRGDYFEIPENGKRFVDILIHNADIINPNLPEGASIGVMYKETLNNGSVEFIPMIDKTGNLQPYFGHITYDCNNPGQLQALKQQTFWSRLSQHFK